jgi:cytochrome c-type biogenesis protein CcmF
MIQLAGQLSLSFALMLALLQGLLPLWGSYRDNPYALAAARPFALGQLALVVIAYVLLTIAFLNSDFTIAYVAENSHASLPFMYRLTAVWGAHEGSILLWILLLNVWTLLFILFEKQNSNLPLVLAILGLISFSFLCFLLLTSNPFAAAVGPQTGHDLNPLLQDPGFVIHPPMLYMGYVGFSVTFAITLAALIRGRLDANWANVARQFAIAAWCFLTLGIMLGSWWAYRVLGWGGFWFWDPVENASLLPWLSGTALIHTLALTEKRGTAKAWSALLALICFALSLLGTFLVRSGVLISAHTFANDPKRGVFLLLLLAILICAALFVYLIRLPQLSSPRKPFVPREIILLVNSILLIVAMLTILLGTLYPLIFDALHLGAISVGAPYFNLVMAPLVLLMMLVMGFAPFCAWQSQLVKRIWQLTWRKCCFCLLIMLIIWLQRMPFMTGISIGLSVWILVSVMSTFRIAPGMAFSHTGFAVFIIGIMLSSSLSTEKEVRLKPGQTTIVGPYQFLFIDTEGTSGSNFRGIRANFEVTKHNRHIVNLSPEKRIYTVRHMVMTKVDIHPSIFRDLYIALGEPYGQDDWSVRLYYKPFIRWIWAGGLLMILGGILGIIQNKKREEQNIHA